MTRRKSCQRCQLKEATVRNAVYTIRQVSWRAFTTPWSGNFRSLRCSTTELDGSQLTLFSLRPENRQPDACLATATTAYLYFTIFLTKFSVFRRCRLSNSLIVVLLAWVGGVQDSNYLFAYRKCYYFG
jgi:hypothetical protein